MLQYRCATLKTNHSQKKMKKIIYLFTIISLISCSSNTPECNDESVKSFAVEMFNKKIKIELVDAMIEEEINYLDLRNYARDRGLNADKVIEKEKQKLKENYDNSINAVLSKTLIKNVRTKKIDDKIHKCTCSAEIENSELMSIDLYYTAQKVEDDDQSYWIEINYNLKNQNEE